MRFYTDTDELVFENNAQYPATRPYEMMQTRERTAGGTIQVETYAAPIRFRTLNFQLMSETDYLGLLDWYINIANGMENQFNFEDERGEVFLVQFTNRKLSFREVSYLRFTGSLELELLS